MMTNKEFCAKLRKAKKLAVALYPDGWCIFDACKEAGILLKNKAIFDKGGDWESWSHEWVRLCAKSPADISAVFDNSIRNLGEEP